MQARYRRPLIVAAVGLVIGVVIGRWIYAIADQPSMASMLAVFAASASSWRSPLPFSSASWRSLTAIAPQVVRSSS
jgi:hypothetical protein